MIQSEKTFFPIFWAFSILSFNLILSQSVFVPINADYQHLIDRIEIKSGKLSNQLFTVHKGYSRADIIELLDSCTNDTLLAWSKKDNFNISYLYDDNWEWSNRGNSDKALLKVLYTKKNAFYTVNRPDFIFMINPILYLTLGKDRHENSKILYQNTRGFELRGWLDKKIGFYAMITENQALFPSFARINDSVPLVYGENYSKKKPSNPNVADFLSARGYLNAAIMPSWTIQFGHDKNFIGNGFRSILLSDHSGSYLFLRSLAKVWKFQYMNIFAQMTATPTIVDSYYRKKYFAMHHLSINITKFINIGFFEIVNFGRPQQQVFDLNYLNPVIFYRSIEQNLGSYDNAMLGFDSKINFLKRFSFYSQVLLDEFLISKFREQKGDWVNKQAIQLGLKYIDVFSIKNLDFLAEFNLIRPFVYQHLDLERSHSHYLQPLAHPLGANLKEFAYVIRYQPMNRLFVSYKLIINKQGIDSINSVWNVGADVRKSYIYKIFPNGPGTTTGHKVGQGIDKHLIMHNLTVSYMFKHNLFADFLLIYRNVDSKQFSSIKTQNLIYSVGIRFNITKREYDF